MAAKLIKAASTAITAATAAGYITVASTTPFVANAKGQMSNTGQPSVNVIITEIVSATVMGIRIVPEDSRGAVSGWVSGTVIGANAPNYGRSNVAAYNGGVIAQNDQSVYSPNDAAALP